VGQFLSKNGAGRNLFFASFFFGFLSRSFVFLPRRHNTPTEEEEKYKSEEEEEEYLRVSRDV
jgi:hypothetical protein